ncbi:hypothetical protein TIFTF001_021932 [Ficus carica]|uniref:Uncharacterized protein n=1 Tax=Ficus carica TaxID=3494 RepID=A0AA88ADM4_FICCA|nr:hypothetical protein TIFTF001_021932 [Ficus carica]
MAEPLLSKLVEAVVSQAVETIAELLKNEAISLISVRGDVKGLQAELRHMKCFLEDANRKQEKDSRVRNWIAEVGDVADDVEDVIETFIWKVSSSNAVFKVFHLHKFRNEINISQAKLNGIFKSTQLYNIRFSSGEGTSSMADQLQRNLRRSYPDDEEDDVIILKDSTTALKEHDLVELLKKNLKEKRYLVVLDDIWRIEAWDSIKNAFPKDKRGSKVLFTARNKEKALLRSTSNEYDIRPEFEVLGREMLRKCEGLPLAIIILGGLLRTRDSIDGWKEVKKDLTAHLNKLRSHQQYEGVGGILFSSYYDLPYYLKPCFLYLGTFPEDSEILKRTLFQLWIAEGFVQAPSHGGETEEDVAEQYMGELTSRCLVQAKDENFFENIQEPEMNRTIQFRRIAIHHPCCDFSSRLRVDFSMLEAICQLIHLRHLGLRDTGITKLPNTISNLQNLYTLDHRNNNVILPRGISRLTSLTHLLAFFTVNIEFWRTEGVRIMATGEPKRISFVRFNNQVKLTNLQNLKIVPIRGIDARALLECPILKTGSLQSLVMSLLYPSEFPNLQPLSNCHHLSKLELEGKIPEANLQYLPPSLVKLSLFYSYIHQDPMPILEKLPNLRFLWLGRNSYCGSEMVCSADGFPKLETLLLTFLPSLEEWQ